MRISAQELQGIVDALSAHVAKGSAELLLFGSRTQDHLKGGDIDLLLLVPAPTLRKALSQVKHRILADVQARIGEQKMDLRISTRLEAEKDPFLSTVLQSAKLLHQWGR